jgi:hypothetical protein
VTHRHAQSTKFLLVNRKSVLVLKELVLENAHTALAHPALLIKMGTTNDYTGL